MRIYFAGPLFSTAECNFNEELTRQLRLYGHEVFLPQDNEQCEIRPDLIFKSDVAGIDWADMVLANLDGPDPDSGTCWELGYGSAKNKLIVVYRTDFRLFEGADKINLMLTESANVIIISPKQSIALLAESIDRNIRERWPKMMRADQYGGFDRVQNGWDPMREIDAQRAVWDKIAEPSLKTPFTTVYRHADK